MQQVVRALIGCGLLIIISVNTYPQDKSKWHEFRTFQINHTRLFGFSYDNKNLVSWNDDEVRIYNVINPEEVKVISNLRHWGKIAVFSPDGRFLSISCRNEIYLYDTNTYTEYKKLKEPGKEYVSALSFSPDGKILVAGYKPFTIILWDVNTGEKLLTISQRDEIRGILFFCFSLDNEKLIVIGTGKDGWDWVWRGLVVQIFDIKTERWEKLIIKDEEVSYNTIAMNSFLNPRLLALIEVEEGGECDGLRRLNSIKLVDVSAGQIRTLIHESPPASMLTIAPDATLMASAHGNEIRFWDIKNLKEITTILWENPSPIVWVVFNKNGGILAAVDKKGCIKLYRNPDILIKWLLEQKIEPPSSEERVQIEKLYQQLASEGSGVRENATQLLIEMGKKVVSVIKEGLNSDDLEVRVRVKHILTEIATRGR